jgi:hypothetical protein
VNDEGNGIEYWSDKIAEVQKEAKAHGLWSVCVVIEDDNLADTEAKIARCFGLGPIYMMGVAEYIKRFATHCMDESEK